MELCLKARVRVLQDVSALFWNFWNHSSCVSASIKINYFNPMFESLQSLLSCTQISISWNPWLLCNSAINKSWWSGDHRAQGKVSSDEPRGSFQSQLPDAPNEGHPTEIGVGADRMIEGGWIRGCHGTNPPGGAKRIRKRSHVEALWSSINPISKSWKLSY